LTGFSGFTRLTGFITQSVKGEDEYILRFFIDIYASSGDSFRQAQRIALYHLRAIRVNNNIKHNLLFYN